MPRLPHVKKPCKDCPFRKDSMPGWLGAERMTEILKAKTFVCHKKTDLQCAGHMLIKGNSNDFVKLATRLGLRLDLSGHSLVFDTLADCVTHHDYEK
ncbi:MAG: hypothetical protein CMB99_16235 [Flavobacteriaceae bacterium]|nr:hypothetical protein [Flavobacteriaceae bacterium]|tara:strand:- start:13153 stop:13443 length:291 start_codon:yes stop_codon:yes gene_type:complete